MNTIKQNIAVLRADEVHIWSAGPKKVTLDTQKGYKPLYRQD